MCFDLTGYKDRIVIGTAGDIVLDGPCVMRKHAELVPATNGSAPGSVALRALEGEAWVERGPVLHRVTGDHVLADGDVIVIAHYRLRYRNVGSNPEGPAAEEVVTWLS